MLRAKSPQTQKNKVHPQRISPSVKKNAEVIHNLLNQLFFKKIRYTFQVLKQFYLFPEGSSSSVMSIQKYDKLIFNDQTIHTLVKKLETKLLTKKLWAFLNIKMMRILKKVSNMTVKMKKVIKKKQVEYVSFGFQRIKYTAIEYSSKKFTNNSRSQTKISGESKISSGSRNLITQTQEISYKVQPRVYIHRGSRSRSHSSSPNSSYVRVLREEEIKVYPKQYRGNVQIHEVTPKKVITKVTERSPAKNYYQVDYQVDQVKREYRNCYRMAPTRIKVVSCGCEHLLQKSCQCTTLLDRLCGCITCNHSCNGCNKCNCCHSHCSCIGQSNRSCSKQKKSIKFIKSPSKKNIEENKQTQNRNNYLNHLQSASIRSQVTRYEYNQTRVTQIRR